MVPGDVGSHLSDNQITAWYGPPKKQQSLFSAIYTGISLTLAVMLTTSQGMHFAIIIGHTIFRHLHNGIMCSHR